MPSAKHLRGKMALRLPPIDVFFSDVFTSEKEKKYSSQKHSKFSPRYIRTLLKRNDSDEESQYLHYYLGRHYADLKVLPKLNVNSVDGVADIIANVDVTKVNMIPITDTTDFLSHISVLIVNPDCATIEYYNTLCLGRISKAVENKFKDYMPTYEFHRSELNFQHVGGADRLCEVWICFIAETRALNRTVPFDEFNQLFKIENFQTYPTLQQQRQAVQDIPLLNPKRLEAEKHWYLQLVLAYALYFEHFILAMFMDGEKIPPPMAEVKVTHIKGPDGTLIRGLVAKKNIKEGTVITLYPGILKSDPDEESHYVIQIEKEYIDAAPYMDLAMDAQVPVAKLVREKGSPEFEYKRLSEAVGGFVNSSKFPNAIIRSTPLEVYDPGTDVGHVDLYVQIVATKLIHAGTQILVDYGNEFKRGWVTDHSKVDRARFIMDTFLACKNGRNPFGLRTAKYTSDEKMEAFQIVHRTGHSETLFLFYPQSSGYSMDIIDPFKTAVLTFTESGGIEPPKVKVTVEPLDLPVAVVLNECVDDA